MDDWLGRSGPLGAILGFALGGVLLLPVGYVYGQWVQRLPDAAGEAAYTAQVFPPIVSYFTGWMMLLAYFIVCPWEAVAVGKLAAYIFPSLNSFDGLLQWWGEMSARMRAEFEWERPSCILLKADHSAVDDSLPPSWAADNSDIRPHGCHRPLGCSVSLAGRF
jgi:hypothetical protein